MGKGDRKTKKGKRILGTYGNSRPKKKAAPIAKPSAKKTTAKKTTAKKSTAKKTAAKKAE